MEYNEKSAGNSFEKLVAEFVEKTGVKTDGAGPNSIDVIADDVMVSAQYRPDRDDCVIFALPVEDATTALYSRCPSRTWSPTSACSAGPWR